MAILPRSSDLATLSRSFSLEALSTDEVAGFVDTALRSAGRDRQRRSPLQPRLVLWLVLSLALFRDRSVPAVFAMLLDALRDRLPGLPRRAVTDGALAHARARLGIRPVRELFSLLASSAPPGLLFHGHRVSALDGVRLSMADTEENSSAFGRGRSRAAEGAWPRLHLVVRLDVGSRLPLDAAIAPCADHEQRIARPLLAQLRAGDLVLVDCGFYGVPTFRAVLQSGAHFLAVAPAKARLVPLGLVRDRGGVSEWEALLVRKRTGEPVVRVPVRVVRYQVPGFRPRRLVTSLRDASIPAEELVELYHRRWEVEIGFDEIKTVLCHVPAGTPRTELRSRSPEGILQEVFALLCAYFLLRRTMAEAAGSRGTPPDRLAFTECVEIVREAVRAMIRAPAENLVRLYRRMLDDIAAAALDRPRRKRTCPRVLKRAYNPYPLKPARRRTCA